MNAQTTSSHHVVRFTTEPQQVFIQDDSQLIPETRAKGCFSYIAALMYNAAEKTILGKTKEKWLFILLGLIVAFLFAFFVINLVQRTMEASASEFTYTRHNETGEYYVVRRKLNANSTSSPNGLQS